MCVPPSLTSPEGFAMAYKRPTSTGPVLEGEALTAALVGIGMAFAIHPQANPNLEDTLVAASNAGMEHDDRRVLALLMTWLEVHSGWINADRLISLVGQHPNLRVRVFWQAVSIWLGKDRRFLRLAKAYEGPVLDLLTTGTAFHLERSGEDPRFVGSPLRVPAGILRNRKQDVLSPAELAHRHDGYRWRILLGPSYRADMWAELERQPGLSAAELARRACGSFATAWHVKRDWALLQQARTA